jgi:hypothetical protein
VLPDPGVASLRGYFTVAPISPERILSCDGDPAKPAVLNSLEQSTTPRTTATDEEVAATGAEINVTVAMIEIAKDAKRLSGFERWWRFRVHFCGSVIETCPWCI